MRAWNAPDIPVLPGSGPVPRLYDTASARVVELIPDNAVATLYVCGITPYDATHLGHAATYLAFDTVQRLWRDADCTVIYAQNVTDVDDPLLERATATGVDWRDLAAEQIELFRGDMAALRILPPEHYVGVTETIASVAEAVATLEREGIAYRVAAPDASDADATDLYYDIAAGEGVAWHLGSESRLDRATMMTLSTQRGGDPDRVGKRDRLDPLCGGRTATVSPHGPLPSAVVALAGTSNARSLRLIGLVPNLPCRAEAAISSFHTTSSARRMRRR